MKKPLPLRMRVFITTAISSLIPLLLAIGIMYFNFTNSFEEQLASQAMDIATVTAGKTKVKLAFSTPDPSTTLQPIAEEIRLGTKAAFVVFMSKQGIRYSHPNVSLIGKPFTGDDESLALKGHAYTSKAVGVSGPSIRAFKPIYDDQNELVGVVAVGFFQPEISFLLSGIYKTFYIVIPLGFLLIVFFSVILANSIKKILFGLEPLEIATMLKERDCMLHSVKEGIIAIDRDSNVTVVNQAARNLFPEDTEFIGKPITELIPDSLLPTVMDTKQPLEDEQLLINGNVVLTNRLPLVINGKVMGAIATFRPLTEVNRIAEELTGVKKIVNALRARTHEFLNKLHVISGLIQLESYDEAKKYITNLTYKEQSLISFLINNIYCSAIVGLLMGKASEAEEQQIQLEIIRESQLFSLPDYFDEHAMVVVVGNLIENAFDAVEQNLSNRYVKVLIKQNAADIYIEVIDMGKGIPPEHRDRIFEPGFTTKEKGQGFGLANLKNRIDVAGGKVSVYSSEQGTAFQVIIPCQLT